MITTTYYTTRQAADALGFQPSRILQMIQNKQFTTARRQRLVDNEWKEEGELRAEDNATRMRYVIDRAEVDQLARDTREHKDARHRHYNEYMRDYMIDRRRLIALSRELADTLYSQRVSELLHGGFRRGRSLQDRLLISSLLLAMQLGKFTRDYKERALAALQKDEYDRLSCL